jgi:hypothetical protein
MQSHGLSMTPVSIEQQKVISWRKSRETQEAFKDKTGWQSQKHRCNVETDNTNKHEDLNLVFANHREEDEIYPLTIIEIAKAQNRDQNLKIYYKQNAKTPEKEMSFQLIENTKVLCKDDKLIIPASLQHMSVSWYHHYLQHPGHSRLEETMRSVMYWKGMQRTCWGYIIS